MDNQPTLKEYLNSKRDDVIMSEIGSFFFVKPNSSKLFKALKTALSLLFIILMPLLITLDGAWPNISFDMAILWPLLLRALSKLEYANSSFDSIDDDDEEHQEVIDWLRSHAYRKHVVFKLLIGLGIIFCIANSFAFLYIRSMVDNQCTVSDINISFFNSNGDTAIDFEDFEKYSEVIIPDTTISDIYINTKITGKPDTFKFKLNGQISSDIHCNKNISFIWDEEIFPQYYFGFINVSDLPDNSVLEISSGSFSRQWTIKLMN